MYNATRSRPREGWTLDARPVFASVSPLAVLCLEFLMQSHDPRKMNRSEFFFLVEARCEGEVAIEKGWICWRRRAPNESANESAEQKDTSEEKVPHV